jgi:hypothetical protein
VSALSGDKSRDVREMVAGIKIIEVVKPEEEAKIGTTDEETKVSEA